MDLRIPINDSLTSCIGHLENINSLIYADFLNIDIFHYINQMNFISITTKVIESESYSVMSDSLQPHGLYSPWNSPGQNTGVGSLSLLQGIFPTQGLNPGLLHCRWILYQLSHKGSPRMLEWGAYPFSSRSSWPRNQTGVSCIAGRFNLSQFNLSEGLTCPSF